MVNWLLDILVPVSLVLMTLLVCHRWFQRHLGAGFCYGLWLLAPMSLLAFSLPVSWQVSGQYQGVIETLVVTPQRMLQEQLNEFGLGYLWLSGVAFMCIVLVVSHGKMLRKTRLKAVTDSAILKQVPNNLPAYYSAQAYSPMIVGVVNPKLVLPEDFSQLYNDEQQSLVLEHEICHFDRNDIYWNLLAVAFVCLFWFHPLVWLAYFRFRQDQELSCDQQVLARKPSKSRINYSKALLVSADITPPLTIAQLSFIKNGDKKRMFERITNIKNNVKATKLGVCMASVFSALLLTFTSYAGNHNGEPGLAGDHNDKAVPVVRANPKYPIEAAKQGIEGSVLLKFDIDEHGKTKNVIVLTAQPENVFNKAAKTALRSWQYKQTGKVTKDQIVQLDFALNDTKKFDRLVETIKVEKQ